jgi:hypothetical protein
MTQKRYPATPEQLAALSVNWQKKHRDIRWQFRTTKEEAEFINRAWRKVFVNKTDFMRGAMLDHAKFILGNLSDREGDKG